MKSKCFRKLQTWTVIVLVVYTLLGVFVYKFDNYTNPAKLILEADRNRKSEIQTQDLKHLQGNLNSALGDLDTLRHDKYEFQFVFLVAIAGIVGFHGWSLYMIGRIKREDLIDHAV